MNYLFGLALAGILYLLTWRGVTTMSSQEFASCLALVMAGWVFEARAIKRTTVDFSCGFVFPMILVLQGSAVTACLALAGGFCVRVLYSKTHLLDLTSVVPPVALGLMLQLTDGWPQNYLVRVGLGIGALLIWKLGFLILTQTTMEQLKAEGESLRFMEEKELSTLRNALASYSLLGSVLGVSDGWVALAALPLCGATAKAAENSTFRVQAAKTERVRREAKQVRADLRKKRSDLEKTARKHELLEDVSKAFAQSLTPKQTLQALERLLKRVVQLDTVALIELDSSPVNEPLILKAWAQGRPVRGLSSQRVEERIVSNEGALVALPVHPLGVVYVGRNGKKAFSRSEAGRLWFAVQKATPALLRTNKQAQAEELLKAEAQLSRQLREKVTLSSKLLEASQVLLTALTREQVLKTFETVLKSSIPHQSGIVLLGRNDEPVWSWGDLDPAAELEGLTSPSAIAFKDDLQSTALGPLLPTSDCLLGVPLQGERGAFGAVLLGFTEVQRPGQEQSEFLATCARLVGASLNALRLSEEVKEAEQRVSQASKMSSIGQLAAGVAHELNTPLATVALAVEAAMARPDKAEKRLARASEALKRAKHIVSQLLDHSRHGEGERVLLDPNALLLEVADLTAGQLAERQQKIEYSAQSLSDKILANENDLKQVLLNLVLNASDACRDGEVIELSLNQVANVITLAVRDRGCGIDDELKSKVFQAFFTTKPVGKGTGLGLSVCKQLVKRHAGEIRFESKVGQGTIFYLDFPARVAHPAE